VRRAWVVFCLAGACGDPAAKPDAAVVDPDAGPSLRITPEAYDYGNLELGTGGDARVETFTLANVSTAVLPIAMPVIGGSQSADYLISSTRAPAVLEPGGAGPGAAELAPLARGLRSAELQVLGPALVSAQLDGTGTVSSARLIISPGARDFGDVAAGQTSAALDFTVLNEADDATLTPVVQPAGVFSIAQTDCGLAETPLHGTCHVSVTWAPPYSGQFVAELAVTAGSAGTYRAGLVGRSSRPLSITPDQGALGSMLVGQPEATAEETFTIRNNGTAPTGPLAASFAGVAAGDYEVVSSTCTTPAPDVECEVTVHLDAATRGKKLAQLVVTDGSSNHARANLDASAYTLLIIGGTTFPATATGQQSAPQVYTVVNASDRDTGAVTASLGSQFVLASNTCAAGVPAHTSCEIGVRFAPSTAGAKAATLSV